MVDEIAAKLGKDPAAFRRAALKNDEQRAVLDKVTEAGRWGRAMPDGFGQGIAFHEEYKSRTACLVEISDPAKAHCRFDFVLKDWRMRSAET